MTANLNLDVVIIGGGIAGLWTLNRLCNRGFNAILLERDALGGDQTVASQGMIHGGIKYTLGGALTGSSEAIADMPDHWRACLRGEGDVDLSGARVLSDHFYLWSTASLSSRFTGFIASKVTRGRVEKVARNELPPIFAQGGFQGTLYRLVDLVMDTGSVLETLAGNYSQRIYKIDWQRSHWLEGKDGEWHLRISDDSQSYTLSARAFVFAAGKGNGELLRSVGADSPQMQLRPLQQVMVRHRYPHRIYGHCIGADKTPRLTLSSHPLADGSQVWYLGGSLAERGARQTTDELIASARAELAELMPWVDLTGADWATLPVARAEPRQHSLVRPDNAFAAWAGGAANIIAAWPTKLTLSPHLADEVETRLREKSIAASGEPGPSLKLSRPAVSRAPWEKVFVDEPA